MEPGRTLDGIDRLADAAGEDWAGAPVDLLGWHGDRRQAARQRAKKSIFRRGRCYYWQAPRSPAHAENRSKVSHTYLAKLWLKHWPASLTKLPWALCEMAHLTAHERLSYALENTRASAEELQTDQMHPITKM